MVKSAPCVWQSLRLACGKVCSRGFTAATLQRHADMQQSTLNTPPWEACQGLPTSNSPHPFRMAQTSTHGLRPVLMQRSRHSFLVASQFNPDYTGSVHHSICNTRTRSLSSQNSHYEVPSSCDVDEHESHVLS